MSVSEDEQDDNNIFDQLKSIKPFTINQLYLLHQDVVYPPKQSATGASEKQPNHHDQNLYQNLVEFEQLKYKLTKLKVRVKQLHRKTIDHVDQIWLFKEETPRKIGMCQQGKIAETTLKYKQAFIDEKQLSTLGVCFSELSEIISKEYMYYSFESQMKRHKIVTHLAHSYQNEDMDNRQVQLRSSITTLIDFIQHLGSSKTDFVHQCRRWLRSLIKRLLEQLDTNECRFVVAQLCKGPPGTADWSSDLVECRSFEQVTGFESAAQYITHCSAILDQMFTTLKSKMDRKEAIISEDGVGQSTSGESPDQKWSLIDPKFTCSEELNLAKTGNTLTECDVIKFCLRVPVAQIFRAYVRKCLESDEFNTEMNKNYEYTMLKLITIGTIIIKTYQTGLETFNSIQYGDLIEYLSSQIRSTVIVLSDQWTEFKRRLRGVDNALMMRLQVEYDNFILRSILIILELRESGIWRHLAQLEPDDNREIEITNSWSTDSIRPAFTKLLQVTGISPSPMIASPTVELEGNRTITQPTRSNTSLTYEFSIEWFKEVSEPMLWHILWQLYHNAFVSLCDYHSDNFWLDKFSEKSSRYLFVNKMRDSSTSECNYLLNSITSMALSRTRQESKLVVFIATEIFNLAFKHPEMQAKITKKGIHSLVRTAEKFPHLISMFMTYMVDEELGDDIVELFRCCSLSGWICNDEEVSVMAKWLIEYPLTTVHNKVSRLIISKLLLNSPEFRNYYRDPATQPTSPSKLRKPSQNLDCFVDLKLRRRLALILYEASVRHQPEVNDSGPLSRGASVEVALGSLFCERNSTMQSNLIELATDTTYQQLYVWVWRLLFTFRLHILNQPETDWNDVQDRSNTSRSTKNTVLVDDSFHPVPSIQDSECLLLSDGLKNQNPMASFICLLMTDITWKADALDTCMNHLNTMANSGHLTPSLMAMKYLTICHLSELSETMAKDQRCIEYFTTVITSNFDATRLASLIISQMQHLKQYRQLQLSHFYISAIFEVTGALLKRQSSSWFSGEEHYLEKIACLLDYIVKFNFPTQRVEIIRKFYDCSYSVQSSPSTNGWLGSLFASNSLNASSTRREFLTILHVLTQKYKQYTWLSWIKTECDTLRLEKIWEDLVVHLSFNEGTNLEGAMKKVCPHINPAILKSTLPIYSWVRQIFDLVETDLSHPLCPLIWYNFFLNYFSNSLNGVSVGRKLLPQDTLTKLMSRLDSLFNYHLYRQRNWASSSALQQNSLAQLYRAYRLWLADSSLQDAYVDIDRLRDDYLVPLLKSVMESSTDGACMRYIDLQSVETQNRNLSQVWSTATRLEGNHLIKEMMFVDSNQDDSMQILTSVDDEASDATSLISRPVVRGQPEAIMRSAVVSNVEEELRIPIPAEINDNDTYVPINEAIETIKINFRTVFEESSVFGSNLDELDKMKSEISELIQQLYTNKKREHLRVVACADGNDCIGPARIKFDVEEATIDDRKSECIQDRQRQCEEIINELLRMPTIRAVRSTVEIEERVKMLVGDSSRAKEVTEHLLRWISEPECFNQLSGPYHASNHLLKTLLEILATGQEADTYNSALIDVCFEHPGSVPVFSPHLSPSTCSNDCFLDMYKRIGVCHAKLGPIATFVLLSKFDVNSWLERVGSQQKHHEIIKTTCAALKDMGKQPDESFRLTFDVYKEHIRVELASPDRRKPEEIALLLSEFLSIMDSQSLAPSLWTDFMAILGLEKQISLDGKQKYSTSVDYNRSLSISSAGGVGSRDTSQQSANLSQMIPQVSTVVEQDESMVAGVVEIIARLADCQKVLDYHALCDLMKILCQFVEQRAQSADVTLVELYQDYLEQFSVAMMSITFMWIKSVADSYPDNHDLIWKQFSDLWTHWVFLTKICQNVSKSSYSLVANEYVHSLRYLISRIPDNTQLVLQSTLSCLANYVQQTREIVYLELTVLQRCLKNLPWANLMASPEDFKHLATLSEQENYNVSDLVSHIILQLNMRECLSQIQETQPNVLPTVVEHLATTIVLQSTHLKGFRLHGCSFTLIPVDRIARIASLILPRMEFANLEHSQNNKLLVNLLRFMCIRLDISSDSQSPTSGQPQKQEQQQHYDSTDSFDRSLIYAKFVSSYLVQLIKNHPTVTKYHRSYLCAVMDNSLKDLKILQSPDVDLAKKTKIYESLLDCCGNKSIDEESCMLLANSLLNSQVLKDRPISVIELFHAIGQTMGDARVLVQTIERMICLYLNMSGHYEKVWKSFALKALPSDLYLGACIEQKTPLALLVYFEALYRNEQQDEQQSGLNETQTGGNNNIWTSFLHWIAQLNVSQASSQANGSNEVQSNEIRMVIVWLKLLHLLEPCLAQFMHQPARLAQIVGGGQLAAGSASGAEAGGDVAPDRAPANTLSNGHKTLLDFIKHLVSIYDTYNSTSIWSYLKSSKGDATSARISLVALSVACFLSDRTLASLMNGPASEATSQTDVSLKGDPTRRLQVPVHLKAIKDEMVKWHKMCLSKLEAARKSKYFQENGQFIETLIESINRSDKVQYSEGVQLIATFAKTVYGTDTSSDYECLAKIIQSLDAW